MDAHVKDNDKAVLVYATFPSLESAEKAATQLIEAELVACVNILPAMISHYRWQGQLQREQEAVVLAKTRASRSSDVTKAIVAAHTYDVPAVVVFDTAGGNPAYLEWVMSETRAG